VLLDMGIQAAMVCNQTVIYALRPAARTRINGVYMIVYFIGGTLTMSCRTPYPTMSRSFSFRMPSRAGSRMD